MKDILRILFQGWILHEKSWDEKKPVHTRSLSDCMIEAAGGDTIKGEMICLFGEWSNDILSLAPHFGIALVRDANNNLTIREDVPPAPSKEHWWHDGQWVDAHFTGEVK